MSTKRAYKERFYPIPEQALLLAQSFGCARFVYNNTLKFKVNAYYNDGKSISHSMAKKRLMSLRQLKYKSKLADRTVVEIDRFFPSSKRCSCCGFVHKGLRLSIREWGWPVERPERGR